MKFNMGCGHNHRDGFTNVDAAAECAPDQVWDLETTPWPWPDSCATAVLFNHSLEHMGASTDRFLAIIKELYRICAPGAEVEIFVPHPRHNNFLDDPTHVRAITPKLMKLFDRAFNDACKLEGAADTPLAHYTGVDFVTIATQTVLDEPYASRFRSGEMTEVEVQTALKLHNNVAVEYRIRLQARKTA